MKKLKNKKSYVLPSKVNSPIMAPNMNYLSVWGKKQEDGVEVKLPPWLWVCVHAACKDAYEKGKNDLKKELRDKLGIYS